MHWNKRFLFERSVGGRRFILKKDKSKRHRYGTFCDFYIVQNRGLHFAFEFAIIIQNKYCALIKCTKSRAFQPCLSCQLVVHLNRISNFQLSFLIALPASRAFIIARNTLYTSLQSQVANLKLASVRALSLVACIVRWK